MDEMNEINVIYKMYNESFVRYQRMSDIETKLSNKQESTSISTIRISESLELPVNTGIIEVDTSKGGVTIFMKSVPAHSDKESLIITKTSHDNNMVSLFSETSLINNAEIIMFGLPIYAKVKKGKVKTIVLKSDGTNWKIIREE